MDFRVALGLWIASMAVSAAATITEPPQGPLDTCVAVALCLAFHIGVALIDHGIVRGRRRPHQH